LGDKLAAKLCYSQEQIVVVVASLLTFFDLVNISGTLTGPQTDRRDDKILECSVTGAATHIVTGDRRHLLQLRRFAGAEILTPAQLIPIVEASPA
jgi:predicted nucleic acid-binding protein